MSPDTDIIGDHTADTNDSDVYGRFRLSPLVLTVFERETEHGTFYDAQIQRVYTEDDGETFEYTESLRGRDMRKAARLFQVAADVVEGLDVRPEVVSLD